MFVSDFNHEVKKNRKITSKLSGGAFYSSGPSYMPTNVEKSVDRIIEPWVGRWRDQMIRVECADSKERIPFLYDRDKILYSLPSQSGGTHLVANC